MLKHRSEQAFLVCLFAFDVLLTCAGWIAAYHLRWSTGLWDPVNGVPPFWWCLRMLPLIAVGAVLSYHSTGLFHTGALVSLWTELIRVARATLLLLLLVLAATFYLQDPYESRLVTVIFWGTTFFGLVLRRWLTIAYSRSRSRSTGTVLIVGSGRMAQNVARALDAHSWLGLRSIGFVDDFDQRGKCQPIGAIDDLPRLVEQHEVGYVFIALPLHRFAETKRIFRRLANTLVEIRLVPDVPHLAGMSAQVSVFEGLPVVNVRAVPQGFVEVAVKRTMDVVFSALGLLLLSPLLALIGLAIKLSDRGPVFYRQERMGLNGRRFQMIKFRSMRIDAESASGPTWAAAGDNRRTVLGTFLRTFSLDELPQLFNVLRGEMSLVGPRPERPFFIETFRKSIPRYMLRHTVKAGITGWAQINGWRGNTSLRKRIQYDLYYIANWSIWLDLRILFLTCFRVMWDRHAY